MAKITGFRLSFIWVETIPSILAHELPCSAPLVCLGQHGDYAKLFEYLRSNSIQSDENPSTFTGLSLPWEKPTGNHFWKFYFEGKQAGQVTGMQAWKKLVPLRKPFDCKQVFPANSDQTIRVTFEAFYAPQGTALVANVNYRADGKSLIEIATLAHDVRWNYRFSFGGMSPQERLSLDAIGERALAKIRQDAFGAVEGFPGHHQPFTVASFISGIGITRNHVIKQGSAEHRSLEALTGWNRYFREIDLATTPLADAALPVSAALPSDLVYARKNARAIWFPRALDRDAALPGRAAGNHGPSKYKVPSLMSCYHRNLVLATLLTLGMGEFVAWVATQHQLQRTISPTNYERAKRMSSVLRMLLDGKKETTYRSISVARTIEAANWPQQMALIASV